MKPFRDREGKGKVGKFRVGDLVTLSAYGLSTEQNHSIRWEFEQAGKVFYGLVTDIDFKDPIDSGRTYPIKVNWIGMPNGTRHCSNFYHRELKIARVK